jgi:hypothetical protein
VYDNKSFHCQEVKEDRRVSPHKFSRPPCEKFLFYDTENDGVGMCPYGAVFVPNRLPTISNFMWGKKSVINSKGELSPSWK